MLRAAILTVSDRSAQGKRKDTSGPLLLDYLSQRNIEVARTEICPDEELDIIEVLQKWADEGNVDLILTTGGTGVAPRDVTPEATSAVVKRLVPGLAEAMRAASALKTPHAALSRAIAGIRGNTLIINLPGSPKGAIENLEAVIEALPHAIAKIQGDPSDCSPA